MLVCPTCCQSPHFPAGRALAPSISSAAPVRADDGAAGGEECDKFAPSIYDAIVKAKLTYLQRAVDVSDARGGGGGGGSCVTPAAVPAAP
jgi:hypothetical protein